MRSDSIRARSCGNEDRKERRYGMVGEKEGGRLGRSLLLTSYLITIFLPLLRAGAHT